MLLVKRRTNYPISENKSREREIAQAEFDDTAWKHGLEWKAKSEQEKK